jgi:hypothetical protein
MRAVVDGEINHEARGLILYHEPGLGKTILAISLANMLKIMGYDVLVLAPKSLESNFQVNIDKLRKIDSSILPTGVRNKSGLISTKDFEFVSTNAGNMIQQLKRLGGITGDISTIRLRDVLKGRVIIIDESHIIANSITNGSSQAVELYKELIACGKSIYTFLLSGSFMTNSPFESAPQFNIVLGKDYFPTDEAKFDSLFGTVENINTNRAMLQNMCSGLVSFVKINRSDPEINARFPEELKTRVIDLPMDDEQGADYISSRNRELDEQKEWAIGRRASHGSSADFGKASQGASTYRMRSRKASNGNNKWKWCTDYILAHPTENILMYLPFINEGGIGDFIKYLQKRSKYVELIVNKAGIVISGPIELRGRRFDVIGSHEVKLRDSNDIKLDGETSEINTKLRERKATPYVSVIPDSIQIFNGKCKKDKSESRYKNKSTKTKTPRNISFGSNETVEFDKRQSTSTIADSERVKNSEEDVKYFCIFTGDTEVEVRQHLIDIMSHPKNTEGRFCHLFMISSTGTTGIDIKNGRHVILGQPFWHMELWEQLKHRLIRFDASEALPKEKRNVQPIILRSVLTTGLQESLNLEHKTTTDIDLFEMGIRKLKVNYAFLDVIHSVSLECLLGISTSPELCRNCIANSKPLVTHDSFWLDQYMPNNCVDMEAYIKKDIIRSIDIDDIDKNDLKQIEYQFTPYYYKMNNGLNIYEMVPEKHKLILMPVGHPYYSILRNVIESRS